MEDESLYLLLHLIEEEFGLNEKASIRLVSPSTTQRAPDLIQDYDPDQSSVHRQSGVNVKTLRHEYFFPVDWYRDNQLRYLIYSQIEEIREKLND